MFLLFKYIIQILLQPQWNTLKHSLLQYREDQEVSDEPPGGIPYSLGPPYGAQTPDPSATFLGFSSQKAVEFHAGRLP